MIEAVGLASKMLGSAGPKNIESLGYAAVGVGTVSAAWKAWEHIPQNHVAIRERFKRGRQLKDSVLPWGPRAGQIYKVVEEGPHITMPGAHRYRSIGTQDRTTRSPHQLVLRDSDGIHYSMRAQFTWGVLPRRNEYSQIQDYGIPYERLIFRALYKAHTVEDLEQTVDGGICVSGLSAILRGRDIDDIDQDAVKQQLVIDTRDELFEYGCDLRRVNLSNVMLLPEEILGKRLGPANGNVRYVPVPASSE